jgi:hypothetical protein
MNKTPVNMKKSRPVENPYEVWQAGDWEWRVLKSWQNDRDQEYARAFCAVSSPYTFGSFDMGDVYWVDIFKNAVLVETNY